MNTNLYGDFQICISVPLSKSFSESTIFSATICTIKFELKTSKELKSLWSHLQIKIKTIMSIIGSVPNDKSHSKSVIKIPKQNH